MHPFVSFRPFVVLETGIEIFKILDRHMIQALFMTLYDGRILQQRQVKVVLVWQKIKAWKMEDESNKIICNTYGQRYPSKRD